MAVSNEEINAYLAANPGLNDAGIASAMNQYGVSTAQMAQATGLGQDVVQSRYNAATAPAAPLYTGLTAQSTPSQISDAYSQYIDQFGGDTLANQQAASKYLTGIGIGSPTISSAYKDYRSDAPLYQGLTSKSTAGQISDAYSQFVDRAGGNTEANQQAATEYLNKIGVAAPKVKSAYSDYLSDAPLYQSLTAQSTPQQIAEAYSQFLQKNGGENQTTQDAATKYLTGIGVSDALTQDAYRSYLGDGSAGSDLYKQFGVADSSGVPTTEGILSGFKFAKDSGLSEDDLKKSLGVGAFDRYKTGLATYAKTGLADILADKKLSFDEAKEAVKFGRDYGYDSQKLAALTGQKKELFDTINKTYDDTTNKIVDSVLGAEDAKTDGDKIARALALQQKYGFTDEDLAKATDFTPAQVKEYLDPTRNYATAYKEVVSKPDASGSDILKFLEDSKKNEGIGKFYGSNIDTQIAKLNELNDKWKDYKVDGYQAENIANQVSHITKAADGKNWSGSWMGGGDNAAKEAVAVLMRKGVDNLSDLGIEKSYEKTPTGVEFYDGQRVFQGEDGSKYTLKTYSNGGDDVQTTTEPLPPDAKTTPGYMKETFVGGEEGYSYTPAQLTADELKTYDPKTGKFDKEIGNKLIDKSTGKVISTSADKNFVIDNYSTGNFFKSKDKSMGIMMTDQGVPVPYQTTEKGGLVYSPIFPILLSLAMPGVASAISGALPGAGVAATGAAELGFSAAVAPTLTNTMLTQGIMGAGTAALTGQDPIKAGLLSAAGAPISAGIGSLLPAGMDPAIARAVTSAGTGVAKGVLQGGDFEDLLGQGVLSGLTNYGLGEATKGLNLTPQQLNLATGIAVPLLQGNKVNPMNVIGPLAKMGQQQTTKATP